MEKPELSPEISAMGVIESALSPLEEDARARVLQWAANRFAVAIRRKNGNGGTPDEDQDQFAELAELYSAASPKSGPDRALVVSYWFQYIKGESEIESQWINSELKHLGDGIGNITVAFQSLIDRKPQLVIQTKKAGKTKQARKKYKVTAQGKKAVENMLQSAEE